MRSHSMISIDGEKLVRALVRRGYSQSRAEKEIGRSVGYISNCIKRGTIPVSTALAFEQAFNIKREEYEIKDETEETKEAEDLVKSLVLLLKRTEPETLKSIVKEAFREVMSE